MKCWGGWSTSWNQDSQENYQQAQICRLHHPNGRKRTGTKEPLDEGEKGEWKIWLKIQHSKNEDHVSGPITSWQTVGRQWKQWQAIFAWVSIALQMVTAAMKLAPSKKSYDKRSQHIKRLRHHFCGPPWWLSGKEPACQCRWCKRCGLDPWVGKIPWRRKRQLTPVFLPTKVCVVKTLFSPEVIYRCKSWTMKKAEHQRIDAFQL